MKTWTIFSSEIPSAWISCPIFHVLPATTLFDPLLESARSPLSEWRPNPPFARRNVTCNHHTNHFSLCALVHKRGRFVEPEHTVILLGLKFNLICRATLGRKTDFWKLAVNIFGTLLWLDNQSQVLGNITARKRMCMWSLDANVPHITVAWRRWSNTENSRDTWHMKISRPEQDNWIYYFGHVLKTWEENPAPSPCCIPDSGSHLKDSGES